MLRTAVLAVAALLSTYANAQDVTSATAYAITVCNLAVVNVFLNNLTF